MQKRLKIALVASLLLAVVLPVRAAQELSATQKIIFEVAKAVMLELKANTGEKPSKADVANKLMTKLRERMDEFKIAYKSECLVTYGENKNSECGCLMEKTDFNEMFDLLEKQLTDISEREKIQKQIDNQENETRKACGF